MVNVVSIVKVIYYNILEKWFNRIVDAPHPFHWSARMTLSMLRSHGFFPVYASLTRSSGGHLAIPFQDVKIQGKVWGQGNAKQKLYSLMAQTLGESAQLRTVCLRK